MQTVDFLLSLFSKNRFLLIKSYIFYFNTSHVNLTFDWALNQPWALEFGYHWRTGAQVVRGIKCDVYTADVVSFTITNGGTYGCKFNFFWICI